MTDEKRLAILAVQDALKLVGVLEESLRNGETLLVSEHGSAVGIVRLAKEKLDAAFAQLGGNRPSKTNEELLREYLESREARWRPFTLKGRKSSLTGYLRFLGDKPLAEVTSCDIRRFVDGLTAKSQMRKHPLREGTLKHFISAVRGLHNFLVDQYGYDLPKMNNIRASDYRGKIPEASERQPLFREEIKKLIAAAKSARDKLIIAIAYYTGLRVGEIKNLELKDVDSDEGLIKVVGGKGGKSRTVRYNKEHLGLLIDRWLTSERKSYMNAVDDSHFFVSGSGKKLAENVIEKMLHSSAKRAEIQEKVGERADGRTIYKVSMHVLRHSFASHANDDGMKFEHVQRQMGHDRPGTTMGYIHDSPKRLLDSYKNFQGLSAKRLPARHSDYLKGGEGT